MTVTGKNFLLIAFLTGTFGIFADKTVYGPATYENQTFTVPLTIMGPLRAKGLTAPKVTVHGPAHLKDSEVGTITVMGPLTAEKTTFNKAIAVYGNIELKDSELKGLLEVSGEDLKIVLEDTKAKDLLITPKTSGVTVTSQGTTSYSSFSTKKPEGTEIYLKDKTIIDGSVTVSKGQAKLFKDDDATIRGTLFGVMVETDDEEDA